MTNAKGAAPPSQLRRPLFILGQNGRGDWVVQDQNGACGGLFVDRKAALGFVRAQNRRQPHNLVVVSRILELDLSDSHRIQLSRDAQAQSAAATRDALSAMGEPLTALAHAAKSAARRH